ncbi:hypothetical protein D3C87_1633980 [compost metagenome]
MGCRQLLLVLDILNALDDHPGTHGADDHRPGDFRNDRAADTNWGQKQDEQHGQAFAGHAGKAAGQPKPPAATAIVDNGR